MHLLKYLLDGLYGGAASPDGLPWDLKCVRRGLRFRVRKGLSVGEYGLVSNE